MRFTWTRLFLLRSSGSQAGTGRGVTDICQNKRSLGWGSQSSLCVFSWPCDFGHVTSSLQTASFPILKMKWTGSIKSLAALESHASHMKRISSTPSSEEWCFVCVQHGADLRFWPRQCQAVTEWADQPMWIPHTAFRSHHHHWKTLCSLRGYLWKEPLGISLPDYLAPTLLLFS